MCTAVSKKAKETPQMCSSRADRDQTTGEKASKRVSHRRWYGYFSVLAIALLWTPIALVHRCAFWLDGWIYPNLRTVAITKPLFVMGLPRSGTTAMHRYLASQKSIFSTMPLWELLFAPALCEKQVVAFFYKIDQRLRGRYERGPAERFIYGCVQLLAGANENVHSTDLNAPEEDTLGLIPFDGCFLRVLAWPNAKRTWQLGYFDDQFSHQDRQRMLKRYRGLVARHLCFRGEHLRYLCKNPGFVSWIDSLRSEFPDAAMVALRRDPAEALPSQLSSLRAGMKCFGHQVEDAAIVERFVALFVHYWHEIERTQRGSISPFERAASNEKSRADSSNPAHNFVVVEYLDLIEDSAQVTLRALEHLGYQTVEPERELLRKMTSRRHRSQHRYRLEEFGLSECGLAEAFHHRPM